MTSLRAIGAKLVKLFVEDQLFAAAIAAWLGAIVVLSTFDVGPGAVRGVALFGGLAVILVQSVAHAARKA